MPGYEVRFDTVTVADHDYQIRSLKDRNQFSDPEGEAEKLGINSATWPLFGMIWQSEVVLADILSTMPLEKKRILEIGCGIGIASLVASKRNADITASDYHPLAESFLEANSDLNQLSAIKFINGNWHEPNMDAGKFDLIIGSDLLYDPGHPQLLADFINSHAADYATIIMIDPGRSLASRFTKLMILNGFTSTTEQVAPQVVLRKQYKGKVLTYTRKRLQS